MIPPLVLRIGFGESPRQWRLWIPLIIVWLILLPFAMILGVPLLLVGACVALYYGQAAVFFRAFGPVYQMFCSLRGLHVEVHTAGELVHISLD